ncbi:hypothetical protein FDECE_7722 [Fusarium decemcellulare]|nr:hypothetical protein FDECE_7722 [Fusarium decemcellulare]
MCGGVHPTSAEDAIAARFAGKTCGFWEPVRCEILRVSLPLQVGVNPSSLLPRGLAGADESSFGGLDDRLTDDDPRATRKGSSSLKSKTKMSRPVTQVCLVPGDMAPGATQSTPVALPRPFVLPLHFVISWPLGPKTVAFAVGHAPSDAAGCKYDLHRSDFASPAQSGGQKRVTTGIGPVAVSQDVADIQSDKLQQTKAQNTARRYNNPNQDRPARVQATLPKSQLSASTDGCE